MSETKKEIFLKDYKTPNYWIKSTNLTIDLSTFPVRVTSVLKLVQNEEHNSSELMLHGIDLNLISLKVNNKDFPNDSYKIEDGHLYLSNLPVQAELETVVEISPDKNLTGEGLYKSGNIFCTQCEAEGFRRITYYLDRPDVMSSFKTKLIADKKEYPYLLSNGDKVEAADLEGGLHYAIWVDPHKKPSYLFACVFGNLGLVKDTFTTKSGRNVSLEIYVDPGNEDKTEHAMRSLINSMKWDEDVFGLEYDLDTYMIVAVDSFNMGAMENKGLNIFNSGYVLAKPTTATDYDFQGIEAVIGHEYFHNWTGNRVTCRDWFQLTLKEGLTVFRDQEFSSDMLDRSVLRIEAVQGLRSHQFPEDAGPMSHPIQPKSFVEISNFYTSTIYEKGAEVIRMIHTLVGKENFRKGMDLYFKRHDGQAVTTQDFVGAMADASGIDLSHFKVWYDQNGTPEVDVELQWDENTHSCKLICRQKNLKLNNNNYDCLYFPFHVSLYSEKGEKFDLPHDGKFTLSMKEQVFDLPNINSKPIPSLNENYTAPVIVNYSYSDEDLTALMQYDQDHFNRYDACQILSEKEVLNLAAQNERGEDLKVSDVYLNAYKSLLVNESLSPAFRSFALSFPSLNELNEKRDIYDFLHLPLALKTLKQQTALALENELNTLVYALDQKGEYQVTAKAMGERTFKNFCLGLLSQTGTPAAFDLIYGQFKNATNMSDEIATLQCLCRVDNPYRVQALEAFYEKWNHEGLVIQKWFQAQAASPLTALKEMNTLRNVEVYDEKIPNYFRSLIGAFVRSNTMGLHAADGSGYKFVADQIINMDKLNPQIAAGLSKSQRFLKRLDESRAQKLTAELTRVKNTPGLSSDTLEVITKNLEA